MILWACLVRVGVKSYYYHPPGAMAMNKASLGSSRIKSI